MPCRMSFNLVIEMLVVERALFQAGRRVYLVFQSRNRDACGGETAGQRYTPTKHRFNLVIEMLVVESFLRYIVLAHNAHVSIS